MKSYRVDERRAENGVYLSMALSLVKLPPLSSSSWKKVSFSQRVKSHWFQDHART